MSQKKKPAKPKPNRVDDVGMSFFTTEEIRDAINEHIARQPRDAKATKRGLIETAIIEYLTKRGSWPRKGKTAPPDTST